MQFSPKELVLDINKKFQKIKIILYTQFTALSPESGSKN
jgi:hypothetical protein